MALDWRIEWGRVSRHLVRGHYTRLAQSPPSSASPHVWCRLIDEYRCPTQSWWPSRLRITCHTTDKNTGDYSTFRYITMSTTQYFNIVWWLLFNIPIYYNEYYSIFQYCAMVTIQNSNILRWLLFNILILCDGYYSTFRYIKMIAIQYLDIVWWLLFNIPIF